jgi:hypothetical protein
VLTGSLRFQVAVSRFIDDVSILAIEDCLVSKLPTLFRSSNVLEMSRKDISRLAGETQESSLERKRLEAKRGILETGLQGLKSLHKRRNVVNRPKQDQVASEDSEQMSAMTPNRSEKASVTTSSAEAAPRATIPDEPSHYPDKVTIPPPVDEWPPQAGFHGDMEDGWAPHIPKKDKKKVSRHGVVEKPHVDREWGY